MRNKLIWLSVFAIAFGFVESSVVVYLREIYYKGETNLFPLKIFEPKIFLVELIREAATWMKENMPQIRNYVTMSPIPNLSAHFAEPPSLESITEFLQAQKDPVAKFHIRNGARILRIIPNADSSEKRKTQSYMNMVNYDYTPNIQGSE